MKKRVTSICALFFILSLSVYSQTISWTSVPTGYKPGSIDLSPVLGPGEGFTGALAVDPANPHVVYAGVGYWQHQSVVRINISSSSVQKVASGFFGSIGGLAVPGSGQLIILDNDDYTTSSIPGETLLIATDKNTDGDFDDPGEIEELLSPILVDGIFGFTGAQARIAPSGNPSGIPSGSLVFQNADGGLNADLSVVTNPTSSSTAAYRPPGGAYFGGFDYNGGFDFDSTGRIFMGAANSSWTGEVFALVNTNGDQDIDEGEYHDLVSSSTLTGSISDLAIDGEDDVFILTNPWGGYQVQTFDIPADPLSDHALPLAFADTDSPFLTALLVTDKGLGFEGGENGGAVMIVGGYASGWANAINLLTLTPSEESGIRDWEVYR